jgi:hypothetical protein
MFAKVTLKNYIHNTLKFLKTRNSNEKGNERATP